MSQSQQKVGGYAWYVVLLCMLAYIFSFIDRQILALLIEPIREDLQISDTQFSLLNGLAFSLFYASMGIPIARLADRRSRPAIIAIGIFLWSLATAATGLGKTFWQIFAARMGVGIGEAALSPAAYSMIADLFPKEKLGRALAVYSIGSFIGGGLAFLIGGAVISAIGDMQSIAVPVLGDLRPWQITFMIVGLPGILLALIFFFTVKDPTRFSGANQIERASFAETLRFIRRNGKFFFALYGGFTLTAVALFGLLSWLPAFLGRNYGLTPGEIGLILGPIMLVANVGGVLCSGWLTDYFEKKGRKDAAMRAGMIGSFGLVIPVALFSIMPNQTLSIVFITISLFFASFPLATSATAMQLASPPHMRAQVSAIFLFLNSIIGLAIGSFVIAIITDYVFQSDQAVGWSVSIVCSISTLLSGVLIARGLQPFREILARREQALS
ncbi:MAG: MFS family permease [Arenicella sp.]|jgi:MFS family permease